MTCQKLFENLFTFLSLAGLCLCAAAVLSGGLPQAVGDDCNDLAPKGIFCLAESERTYCSHNNREICNVSQSKQSGGFQDMATTGQEDSHAVSETKNVKCYTTRSCRWHTGDDYDPAGCYGHGDWTDVSQDVTIYTADECGE